MTSSPFLLSAMTVVLMTGVTLTTIKYNKQDAVRTADENIDLHLLVTANPKISHTKEEILNFNKIHSLNNLNTVDDDRSKRESFDNIQNYQELTNKIEENNTGFPGDVPTNTLLQLNITDKFPNQIDYEKREKVKEVQ